MPVITHEEAKWKILETKNIFSVQFVKKDGSVRAMRCRLNVKKHLKGGVSTTAHIPNLICVFEMTGEVDEYGEPVVKYRNINADTLITVKTNGTVYNVIEAGSTNF